MMNQDTIAKALHNMNPLSEWVLSGDTYEDLVWHSDDAKPTKKAIEAEIALIEQKEAEAAQALALAAQSAKDKLLALGLSELEIAALRG